jgi:hypothetical protein
MKRKAAEARTVSVSDELAAILNALEAVKVIVEELRVEDLPADLRKRHEAMAGVLCLALVRLRDLGRVVRGALDPGIFWAEHSATSEKPAAWEDHDVRLTEGQRKQSAHLGRKGESPRLAPEARPPSVLPSGRAARLGLNRPCRTE